MVELSSSALSVFPEKRRLNVLVAYHVCDVISKFNLWVITKQQK